MFYLAFIISLLVGQFFIALYLYNKSYCGTSAQCDVLLGDNGSGSCVLSSSDSTANSKGAYIAFIFTIILFVLSVLIAVYYIKLSSGILSTYKDMPFCILLIAVSIIIFAFNILAYQKCGSGNCSYNMPYPSVAPYPTLVSCRETTFQNSSIYNFYISICVIFSVIGLFTMVYLGAINVGNNNKPKMPNH